MQDTDAKLHKEDRLDVGICQFEAGGRLRLRSAMIPFASTAFLLLIEHLRLGWQ